MKKIMLLLVLVSALENAFADNNSKVNQQNVTASQATATPKAAIVPTKSEASQESAEPKAADGKPSFWCKSWKEHGAAWEFWPLYKMGQSSCESNHKE